MWDLYLQVKKFPKGSEIIFTGITIPDMTRIAEEHGIEPVPVDLDIHTLMPSLEDIQRATSTKTVAMIFAYIYGVQYDIAPYVPWLKQNNIEIIEDCA
jgi:dTDP-4-amino-4,6-dideoxygalactose transaminase